MTKRERKQRRKAERLARRAQKRQARAEAARAKARAFEPPDEAETVTVTSTNRAGQRVAQEAKIKTPGAKATRQRVGALEVGFALLLQRFAMRI